MVPRHPIGALGVLIAVVVPACSRDAQLPLVFAGDNYDYRAEARAADDVCAGTFEYLDRAVGSLSNTFELDDRLISFGFAPENLSEFCSGDVIGCAHGGTAYSKEAVHLHEVVHALRRDRLAAAPFEEGAAEAFGDDWGLFGTPAGNTVEVISDWTRGDGPPSDYPRLGHFVSFMKAEYGMAGLLDFLERAAEGASFEQLRAVFADTFGESLAEAATRYEQSYPLCDAPRFRDDAVECGGDSVGLPGDGDGPLTMSIPISCQDSEVVGPRRGEMWRSIALSSKNRAMYNIRVEPIGAGTVRFSECDRSCFAEDEIHFEAGFVSTQRCLEKSTYLLRLSADTDSVVEFDVRFAFVGPCS